MPATSKRSWICNWAEMTNNALQELHASKRQVNADYNARIRLLRTAQQIGPNQASPHMERIIRAPLAGLR